MGVLQGRQVLDDRGADLDDLHAAVGAPITARTRWLRVWTDSYTDHSPMAVVVERSGGGLDAAALLASHRRLGMSEVVALGHGPSDAVTMAARDAASAEALAVQVASALAANRAPWTLTLRHVVSDDLVVRPLARVLRHSSLVRGDVLPILRVGEARSLRAYVSRNHHQQVQRLRNRIRREAMQPVVAHLHRPADIRAAMPEVERVLRARDADVGRRCALDDAASATFLRGVVDVHAAAGEVCLTTLWLGDALAAYVLCFLDGGVYRMWSCRFDPRWSRFGVGKIAMDESVQHALEAGADAYDFMRGTEQYKDSYANGADQAWDLRAWSGPVLAAGGAVALAARARLASMETAGGAGARVAGLARRVAGAGTG